MIEKPLDTNEKIKRPMEAMPLLPELEPLYGTIASCEYQIVKLKGVTQYYLDSAGAPTDKVKKEFYMVVNLHGYDLKNGKPRNQWIRLGASYGEKALLPKVLLNLGFKVEEPTADDVCKFFRGREIKFQLNNKVGDDMVIRQKLMVETIRNVEAKKANSNPNNATEPAEMQWKD